MVSFNQSLHGYFPDDKKLNRKCDRESRKCYLPTVHIHNMLYIQFQKENYSAFHCLLVVKDFLLATSFFCHLENSTTMQKLKEVLGMLHFMASNTYTTSPVS
jgi:hypothetical protein